MPICPKGHTSTDADYCDECGSPIGAAAVPAGVGSAAEVAGPDAGAGPQTCPQCGAVRTGRFCEVDGYDFVAADLGGTPAAEPDAAPAPTAPPGPDDAPPPAAPPGPDAAPGPADVARPGLPAAEPVDESAAWQVTVAADEEYHKRVLAMGGPDADAMVFPQYFPERRFRLAGTQVLIGRHSRSRGIDPQIDLSGPPEDPGVSHSHALLVHGEDGTWALVDLDSANGTYVNDGTEAVAPNVPVVLHDGDRVHVGAWTTLTLSAP